jgi:predicted hotdog family 3-hydroxylacyl-ACP dehydratase
MYWVMNSISVNIDALIPHRRPLRLIDEILEVDEDSAVTAATVAEQWPLFANGAVNPIVLIELVAQTALAHWGYTQIKKSADAVVRKGFLVGVQHADFFIDEIPVHTRITTRSTTRVVFDNFREISGVARIGEDIIGEIRLQSVKSEPKESK